MANVMTTKELSRYLNSTRLRSVNMPLSGKFLPFGLGAYGGRFDKDVIDEWITTGQNETKADGKSKRKGGQAVLDSIERSQAATDLGKSLLGVEN